MKVSKRARNNSGVDLSPMLDVIFQLILFFLVSTTFAKLPGITVNLPKSSTSQGTDVAGITISVSSEGKMYFNDDECTLDTLGEFLEKFDVGDLPKDTYPVTVAADEEVKSKVFVGIFDVLRKNGFSAVSLRTSTVK